MKRIILFLPLAALLGLAACNLDDDYNDRHGDKAVIPPVGVTIKMMTYNIYGAVADHGTPADLDALAEVIRRQDPDFVALQECDVFNPRTGIGVHQARDLAKKLDMYWHFTPAIHYSGNAQFGEAVLSKYRILETYDYTMTAVGSTETRAVCAVKVNVEGEPLYVMSTHFDHLTDENRVSQANQLRDIINATPGSVVIGGDFNATPGSEAMTIVRSYMTAASQGKFAPTYSSEEPVATIDYILYTPLEAFSTIDYRVMTRVEQQVNGADASDHLPVLATLQLRVEQHEGPQQPDNIAVSFAEPGLRDVLNYETDQSAEITVERDVDAEETFVTFAAMSADEVKALLPAGETYNIVTAEQWSIEKESLSFKAGDMSETTTVNFKLPEMPEQDTYYALGLTMTSATPEVTIDPVKGKVVLRIMVPGDSRPRGSGTEADPYLIYTVKDMLSMKEKVDAAEAESSVYFGLMEDIDLAGKDWTPLLDLSANVDALTYRVIHFEGNDHTISNLTCADKPYASFFGMLAGSCRNVTFENAAVSATTETPVGIVAAVVGHYRLYDQQIYGDVTNTHVSGTVTAPAAIPKNHWGFAGGICGDLRQNCTIENCSARVNVYGTQTGGICGDCFRGNIKGCFSQSEIHSAGWNVDSHAGGIVGLATNCNISDCYTGGSVTSDNKTAGGIVGWQNNELYISRCYSTCSIKAEGNAGGIAGASLCNNAGIEYCIAWNDGDITSNNSSSGLVAGWVKGNNRTMCGCYYRPDIKLMIKDADVDYTKDANGNTATEYVEDAVGVNLAEMLRYNGTPGEATLKATASNPDLGWDASVWDLTGDAPKLQWENLIP